MIPEQMKLLLEKKLPLRLLENRAIRDKGRCYLELGHKDEQILAKLGITTDKLGPHLVALLWDEHESLAIGGYVVIDNLSMGSPSMGGIRMLPDITPQDIHNLARGMTLKNAAANLPYGGGKSGILVPHRALSANERSEIIRRFARLLRRYRKIYVPGPDVGTNDNDMRIVATENGLDSAVSKPAVMGGNRIDEVGAAAGGVVIALETLLDIMPRLKVLPQFAALEIPEDQKVTVIFQGFGAVGAHAAHMLKERIPTASTIGISDRDGYLFDPGGLPIEDLFRLWKKKGLVTHIFHQSRIVTEEHKSTTKFSTDPNDLLRESAFCLVPAAAVFNYLGVDPSEQASMTVDRMGRFAVIVEGANTYSPAPNRKAVRMRMEQVVYRQKGVMVANDYLVNSGGVIFAAQEHLLPTPAHLQIPEALLGRREAVDRFLEEHSQAFEELSRERLLAGEAWREKVIRRNMIELVDLLSANDALLPCQAADRISLQRLTEREQRRQARDIMMPIEMVDLDADVSEAAARIVASGKNLAAVVDSERKLVGVVTAWDIAKAIAEGSCEHLALEKVMTRKVISADPGDTLLTLLHKLEENQISAMPVVKDGRVLGLINSDLLAYRYLQRFLKAEG
jgi:glutamate dehydrogenase (NAD(P)+)